MRGLMLDESTLDTTISSDIQFRIKSQPSILTNAYQLRVHASTCPREGEAVYRSPWHLIEATLAPAQPIWSGFCNGPRREAVKVGRIMFVPKDEAVKSHFTRGTRRTVTCLFDLEALGMESRINWDWRGVDPLRAFDVRDPFVQLAIQRLGQEALAPSFASNVQVECTLIFLAAQLQRYFRAAPPDNERDLALRLSPAQLRRVTDRIHAHGEPLPSVSELATLVGLGSQSFSIRFRNSMGQTLRSYIANNRLERAKQMLTAGNHMIKQIAYECGFSSPASFAMSFRQEVGISPTEFRIGTRLN